jgi:hypothetical protein
MASTIWQTDTPEAYAILGNWSRSPADCLILLIKDTFGELFEGQEITRSAYLIQNKAKLGESVHSGRIAVAEPGAKDIGRRYTLPPSR